MRDTSNSTHKLFVNGSLAATKSFADDPLITEVYYFSIGSQDDGYAPLTGQMKLVRTWNRMLSESEVSTLAGGY
jgi:hypothetical protein